MGSILKRSIDLCVSSSYYRFSVLAAGSSAIRRRRWGMMLVGSPLVFSANAQTAYDVRASNSTWMWLATARAFCHRRRRPRIIIKDPNAAAAAAASANAAAAVAAAAKTATGWRNV